MKNLLLLSLLLFTQLKFVQAQSNDTIEKVFTIVEASPQFPNGTDALMQFIRTNINYPEIAHIGGTVYVTFVVDRNGKVKDAKVLKSREAALDAEALRVVNQMPDWIPGTQNGQRVAVQFNLPIYFGSGNSGKDVPLAPKYIQTQSNDTLDKENRIYTIVEVPPQFPNGGEAAFMGFLQSNIKYPIPAKENGIEGVSYVQFVIEKDGRISNAKIIGSSNNTFLDNEALRVVNLMPDWTPAMQKGERVAFQYDLPLRFELGGDLPSDKKQFKDGGDLPSDKKQPKEKYPLIAIRLYDKGIAAFKENNFEEAILSFDKAIKKSPDYVDAYYNRGVAHHKLNHKTESCNDWNKCKELGDTQVDKLLETHCK